MILEVRFKMEPNTCLIIWKKLKHIYIYMIYIYIHNILLYILVKSSSRPVFDPFLGWMMLDVKSKGCQCWQLFLLAPHYSSHSAGEFIRATGVELKLLGGIPTPLKNVSSSVGMMKFPIYGKIKFMFQTTNQLDAWSCDHVIMCIFFCKPQTQSLNEVWVGRLHRVHQG